MGTASEHISLGQLSICIISDAFCNCLHFNWARLQKRKKIYWQSLVEFLYNYIVQVHHLCWSRVNWDWAEGRKWLRKLGQSCNVALEGGLNDRNREEMEIRQQEEATLKILFQLWLVMRALGGRDEKEMRVSEWHSPKESDPSYIIKQSSGF